MNRQEFRREFSHARKIAGMLRPTNYTFIVRGQPHDFDQVRFVVDHLTHVVGIDRFTGSASFKSGYLINNKIFSTFARRLMIEHHQTLRRAAVFERAWG